MAITRSKKEEQLAALQSKFDLAVGVAFVKFNGATVNEVQDIRRSLRADGMSYTVIKKTLIALAAKNAGKAEFSSHDLEGNVAVIISEKDEVSPAGAIKKLKKESFDKETKTSTFNFAGAIFGGKFLNEADATILGNTPSREESLGKIVAMLKSGPQKLHGILNSGLQRPYNVLKNADKFAKA